MQGEEKSTEGPSHRHVYCSVLFYHHVSHGKHQPEIAN